MSGGEALQRVLDDVALGPGAETGTRTGSAGTGVAATGPAGTGKKAGRSRLDLEPDTVERDLIKLVLTVVELLRQLMERQAVRRFDTGDLSEDQEERIGLTLMLLDDRMAELRDRYGLRPEDLNLDLGPLGPLLPRD
ncbi:gas vesicle protein K [Streptomyces sp. A15ISP2-DRY2]|uniref:Gas vesicle protein K n=1 Tax=Streptomyces ortus TaxID=2867268 RepID=A0ABT3VC01_9ACTN|nr:gas vesicle protein K [Streptomyces ortus]